MTQEHLDTPPDTPFVRPADPAEAELLERYLERRQTDLQRLRQALARHDYELVRRIGHNLHGSGSAYGLRRITLLGERLERAAERTDHPAIDEIVDELGHYLSTLVVAPH